MDFLMLREPGSTMAGFEGEGVVSADMVYEEVLPSLEMLQGQTLQS